MKKSELKHEIDTLKNELGILKKEHNNFKKEFYEFSWSIENPSKYKIGEKIGDFIINDVEIDTERVYVPTTNLILEIQKPFRFYWLYHVTNVKTGKQFIGIRDIDEFIKINN